MRIRPQGIWSSIARWFVFGLALVLMPPAQAKENGDTATGDADYSAGELDDGSPLVPQRLAPAEIDSPDDSGLVFGVPDHDGDAQGSAEEERAGTIIRDEKAGVEEMTTGESDFSPSPSVEELGPELATLRDKVRRALELYYRRHLNSRDHSPWEVMHGIISYGVDAQLFRGGPRGPKVNAIGWLCYNGACRGEQMLYLHGEKLVARKGPGLQGHFGQFLAILAQSHVKTDYPMIVGGKQFMVADLIEHEMKDCQAGEELTFKLIALAHYLREADPTWTSRDGQTWNVERLIREELKQPIRGAACGGTHRLMGLSYAVNKRIQRGQSVTGEYLRAQKFISDYHRYTFSLQNPDGSFSTEWFARRGAREDVDRRLKTTGHILEWLSFSLSNDELRLPSVVKSVDYLAGILEQGRQRSWEIGPLGHGLHALVIYDRRVFQPADSGGPFPLAQSPNEHSADSIDSSALAK